MEPTNFYQGVKIPEWRKIMFAEIGALKKNNTWSITTLPPAIKGWSLHQLDVNNVFLHENLTEEVHIQMPLGDNKTQVVTLKNILNAKFSIKDLNLPKYFLRIEIAHSSAGCQTSMTQMEQNVKFSAEDGDLILDPSTYQLLIGRLMYLKITRPDILFTVNVLSQFMQTPRHPHFKAALCILLISKGVLAKAFFNHLLVSYHSWLMLIQIGQVVLIPAVLQVVIVLFVDSILSLGESRSKV
ncbi:uncharacterized protein LOC132799681 [Ziziphus jujuba]|uniref:Uncharacterized protein LOC132799681 n=1 Tax=Ziziphus jujuba TaxID=326968 RepID=A0ABM3ZUD4_ZIZJJ|nr:uncharacterized protein LOC132799681 [Ziziphus jujuba]